VTGSEKREAQANKATRGLYRSNKAVRVSCGSNTREIDNTREIESEYKRERSAP
jgi:hypothetical protein